VIRATFILSTLIAIGIAPASAQTSLPPVGPERPFTPPPRVERTLSNGLRVIAVRYGSVP